MAATETKPTPARRARRTSLEIVSVALDDLHIDRLYQRSLNSELVGEIASNWDQTVAGPILVSRRPNADLFVIDGQHRVAGAKLAGETHIDAQIDEEAGSREEATMRLARNKRRADNSLERFKAQLAAGVREAIAIKEICAQFDTQINVHGTDSTTGINAVAAVESIYRVDRGMLLVQTFELIRDSFGSLAGQAVYVHVLKGCAYFLQRHTGDVDRNRVVSRARSEGVEALERAARSHQANLGGARWLNFYRALVVAYNKNLPESARIDFSTARWTQAGLGGTAYAGGGLPGGG